MSDKDIQNNFIVDKIIVPLLYWVFNFNHSMIIICFVNLGIALVLNQVPPGNIKATSVFFYLFAIIAYLVYCWRYWILSLITVIISELGAYYHAFVLQDICEPDESFICFMCLNIFIMVFAVRPVIKMVNAIVDGTDKI